MTQVIYTPYGVNLCAVTFTVTRVTCTSQTCALCAVTFTMTRVTCTVHLCPLRRDLPNSWCASPAAVSSRSACCCAPGARNCPMSVRNWWASSGRRTRDTFLATSTRRRPPDLYQSSACRGRRREAVIQVKYTGGLVLLWARCCLTLMYAVIRVEEQRYGDKIWKMVLPINRLRWLV